MDQIPIIHECIEYVRQICIKYDIGADHGIDHAIAVANTAALAFDELKLTQEERINVTLACLMHDIDDDKLIPYHMHGKYINATEFIKKLNPQDQIHVMTMIKLVGFSINANTINIQHPKYYYLPRDADRINAGGPVGIERTVLYNKKVNRPLINGKEDLAPSLHQLMKECVEESKTDPTSLLKFYRTNWFKRSKIASDSIVLQELIKEAYDFLAEWVVLLSEQFITEDLSKHDYEMAIRIIHELKKRKQEKSLR